MASALAAEVRQGLLNADSSSERTRISETPVQVRHSQMILLHTVLPPFRGGVRGTPPVDTTISMLASSWLVSGNAAKCCG